MHPVYCVCKYKRLTPTALDIYEWFKSQNDRAQSLLKRTKFAQKIAALEWKTKCCTTTARHYRLISDRQLLPRQLWQTWSQYLPKQMAHNPPNPLILHKLMQIHITPRQSSNNTRLHSTSKCRPLNGMQNRSHSVIWTMKMHMLNYHSN